MIGFADSYWVLVVGMGFGLMTGFGRGVEGGCGGGVGWRSVVGCGKGMDDVGGVGVVVVYQKG